MRNLPLALLPLLALLPACSSVGQMALAPPAGTAAGGSRVDEKSDLLEFSYGWPREVSMIPALEDRLEADRSDRMAEALKSAQEDRTARGSDAPFNQHFFKKEWRTAGATPRLLSIEAEVSFFTGGAHPNALFDSVLWDRQAGRALALADWFSAPDQAVAELRRAFCPALDRLRLEKRGGATLAPGTWETECPDLAKQSVIPADTDANGRFDRLFIKLPPYEAGPYAEGDYVVELPVTAAFIASLRPEYRASFEA